MWVYTICIFMYIYMYIYTYIYIYWLSHMYMQVYDIRSERMRRDGAFTLPCHLGSEFLSCPETLMACLVVALPASWESNDRCDFRASHPVTLKTAAKSRTAIEHLWQLMDGFELFAISQLRPASLIWRFGWFGECFPADPANLTHDHKCYSDLKFKINLEEFEIPLLGIWTGTLFRPRLSGSGRSGDLNSSRSCSLFSWVMFWGWGIGASRLRRLPLRCILR